MADRDHAWVLTTTLPDGTFDIFQFAARLQQATLLELQTELLYAETCANEYRALTEITFGKAGEDMKAKADLYESLWALIDYEILNRIDDEFKPQHPS